MSDYDSSVISKEYAESVEKPSSSLPSTNDLTEPNASARPEIRRIDSRANPNEVTGYRLWIIVASLASAVFCVALDNTILSPATPKITDTFHTISDIGWYGAAYLLTICSFQLLYAKMYAMIHVKTLFLVAVSFFEIGSIICATAPQSKVLVVGRAIAGLGAAGILTGANTAIALVASVKLRPILMAVIGAIFGLCAVGGPMIGGAFTQSASWRWCFYINLPLGGITIAGAVFFLKVEQTFPNTPSSIWGKIKRVDPAGTILFIGAIICLLLATQWGGATYPWSNARIIVLFVITGVASFAFAAIQPLMGEHATIPVHIIKQRTMIAAVFFAFFIGSVVFPTLWYLPVWFQAVKGVSPIMSAVHTIPLIIPQIAGTVLAGYLTSRFGYFTPFVYLASITLSIGLGLFSTLSVNSSAAAWIGYQIPVGFGVGFGLQQPVTAAQVALPLKDIPTGVALAFTFLYLGGAIFISAGQSVFTDQLRTLATGLEIPGLDVEKLVQAGATELRSVVPPEHLNAVLVIYNAAIVKVFQMYTILACLTILGAFGMPWWNINTRRPKKGQATEGAAPGS